MCARSLLSSPRFWLGLLLVFSFLVLSPLKLTAQSTTSEQPTQETKPSSETDSKLSLSEALKLIESTLSLLLKVRTEADSWRLDSLRWQTQAQMLSAELMKERQDSQERETLSQASLDNLKRLNAATDKLTTDDQKAIDQARAERMAWAGGGFLVGAALTAVTVFVFHR
jgi:hypothetical protein